MRFVYFICVNCIILVVEKFVFDCVILYFNVLIVIVLRCVICNCVLFCDIEIVGLNTEVSHAPKMPKSII